MADAYNDNTVPHGGFSVTIKRGGTGSPTTVITAIIESITPTYPTVEVRRPDAVGGPNGFALVAGQVEYSGEGQIATSATETPKVGDWFTHVFDGGAGGATETVVFKSITAPKIIGQYFKFNFTANRAYNPPA